MNISVQSKRLLSLWDRQRYGKDKKKISKPIDGIFIFNSLFSVSAFASRKEVSVTNKLAKKTAEQLLISLRSARNDINKMSHLLVNNCGDIETNSVDSLSSNLLIEYEQKKLTPETAMLMKVFVACDDYFVVLYKAKLNGEITDSEQVQYRKQVTDLLVELFKNCNKRCLAFHKVRKNYEVTT